MISRMQSLGAWTLALLVVCRRGEAREKVSENGMNQFNSYASDGFRAFGRRGRVLARHQMTAASARTTRYSYWIGLEPWTSCGVFLPRFLCLAWLRFALLCLGFTPACVKLVLLVLVLELELVLVLVLGCSLLFSGSKAGPLFFQHSSSFSSGSSCLYSDVLQRLIAPVPVQARGGHQQDGRADMGCSGWTDGYR